VVVPQSTLTKQRIKSFLLTFKLITIKAYLYAFSGK